MSAAAQPDPIPAAPPLSVEEALDAVASWGTDPPPFRIYQIAIALAAEVEVLRTEIAGNANLEQRESAAWRAAYRMAIATSKRREDEPAATP